ncbi:MAG: energy transducer TonB [Spirochaetia bacterium]|nr:energy transducer TonB [Spirochaetia bacterium]
MSIKKVSIVLFYQIIDKHPYRVSLFISLIISIFTLTYSSTIKLVDTVEETYRFDIIDISEIKSAKRITKKEVSTEQGEISDASPVERAQGVSEAESAVDLAYFPNVAPPRLVSKLKKIYPSEAKELNIEATVFVELTISSEGRVLNLEIIGIRLSKEMPAEIYSNLVKKFSLAAVTMFKTARFTPPVVEGKKIPVKMEQPLKFKLE